MMGTVKIRLFGNPELMINDEPVSVKRRKTVALMAYLAVVGQSRTRDALAGMFWPEMPDKKALSYLRNALWELNQTPLKAFLSSDRRTVYLRLSTDEMPGSSAETAGHAAETAGHAFEDPSPVGKAHSPCTLDVDVAAFRHRLARVVAHDHAGGRLCHTCLTHLERAISLRRDPFLSGFLLPDSPEFDQWMRLEEEVLQREYNQCLHTLTDHYYYAADWSSVVRTASLWMASDPLNETAYRHAMVAAAGAGQTAGAMQIYEQCRTILQDELDIEPDDETEALYYQLRTGQLSRAPEMPAKDDRMVSIPVPRTRLVGRRQELSKLRKLFKDSDCRLITLTGPGGCGKTRLAMELAREVMTDYTDGVAWVTLEPIRNREPLLPAFLNAVGYSAIRDPEGDGGGETWDSPGLLDRLKNLLAHRQMLLVVDNAEHRIEHLGFLGNLVPAALGVQILVTTRERLNLQQEWVVSLEGLPCPAGTPPALEPVETNDALELFVQISKRAMPGRMFSADELQDMAAVCRRVEGNPLAIELASVWMRSLSPADIRREIETDLGFLSTNQGDIPARHRSIRTIFDHTWTLLPEPVQGCFRRLSVFRGGFRREAALSVAGADPRILDGLISRSILRRMPNDRYHVHDLLRQFAAERLRSLQDESVAVHQRHTDYYLQRVRDLGPSLRSYQQENALDLMNQDMDNIRAAWLSAAETGNTAVLLETVNALFFCFDIQTRFHDGWELFREAETRLGMQEKSEPDKRDRQRTCLMAVLQAYQGWFIRYIDRDRSEKLLSQGAASLMESDHGPFWALVETLSVFAGFQTDETRNQRILTECLEIFDRAGDGWMAALVMDALALGTQMDDGSARNYAERSLTERRRRGDVWGMALSHSVLALLAEAAGDWDEAFVQHRKSLMLRRKQNRDMDGIVDCLTGLGRVELQRHRPQAALDRYREAIAVLDTLNNRGRRAGLEAIVDDIQLRLNTSRENSH